MTPAEDRIQSLPNTTMTSGFVPPGGDVAEDNNPSPRFNISESLSGIFRGINEGEDSPLHIAARRGDSLNLLTLVILMPSITSHSDTVMATPNGDGDCLCSSGYRIYICLNTLLLSLINCLIFTSYGNSMMYINSAGIDPKGMPYRVFIQNSKLEPEVTVESRKIAMQQLNSRNRLGATPLWLAAAAGHEKAISVLCEHAAKLEIPNIKGQTPLFAAAKYNNVNCVETLLKAGADPDGNIRNISTPIYIAARENFVHVVKLLIQYGADVNGRFGEKDEDDTDHIPFIGSVPLYMTIVYQNFECFRQLILNGAELHAAANNRGFGTSLVTGVLRHQCDVRYLRLIALCGGIRHGDKKGIDEAVTVFRQFTHGLASTRKECLEFLDSWNERPLRLTQICRIIIRHQLGQKNLRSLGTLNLPARIHNYIMLSHLVTDSM